MKNKKRIKVKKKVIFPIISIFLVLILLAILTEKILENNYLKHFNKYVVTTKETNIYNKNNKPCGTIIKNTELELSNENHNNKYFNIKNTNYYIYYKDIKSTTQKKKKEKC